MEQLISFLASILVGVISSTGYLGVVVLMAIESACIPLPSEIIMPFAGYLVSMGKMSLLGAATAGAVGCNLGSTVAYYIGRWGERSSIERWGRYLLITPGDVDRAHRFFNRFGSATVFIGRLLPVVRTFIALPAGFAEMNMIKFQIYTFVGSWIWCFALAWIGLQLGDRWEKDPTLHAWFHSADLFIGILLLAAIAWWVYRHVAGSKK